MTYSIKGYTHDSPASIDFGIICTDSSAVVKTFLISLLTLVERCDLICPTTKEVIDFIEVMEIADGSTLKVHKAMYSVADIDIP